MHNLRVAILALFLLLLTLAPAMLNRSMLSARQEFDLTPYQQPVASDAAIPAEILLSAIFQRNRCDQPEEYLSRNPFQISLFCWSSSRTLLFQPL